MKVRYLVWLFVCFLFALVLESRVWAHCPACTGTCEKCVCPVCVEDPTMCSGCCKCVNGNCEDDDSDCNQWGDKCCICNNCSCTDDSSKCPGCCNCCGCWCLDDPVGGCSGCCKCSNCGCVDDSNKCDPDECCEDCNCLNPLCHNCHILADTQYECGHGPNSVTCETFICMKNVINTATCYRYPSTWPCDKKNCNTAPDGNTPAIKRTIYFSVDPCPKGGDPVVDTWCWSVYHGCGSDCAVTFWLKACDVDTCDTAFLLLTEYDGQKYKCGCP